MQYILSNEICLIMPTTELILPSPNWKSLATPRTSHRQSGFTTE